MTDRELLEKAAKAAGIEVITTWENEVVYKAIPHYPWNPLTDDGDALRLAVCLGLCVIRETVNVPVVSVVDDLRAFNQLTAFRRAWEPIGGDPQAATRRAIVRAAADIGERTP